MNTVDLLKLAKERLELFESGGIPLHQLVGDLKSVQDSLRETLPRWTRDFDSLRFALEEVNALRLDGSSESGEQEKLVQRSVRDLKRLIDRAISEPTKG